MSALRSLAVLAVAAAACGGEPSPTLDDPWRPGDPGDPTCGACVEVATLEGGHAGDVVLLADPTADDPYAQYGRCIASILACWEGDGDLPGCVAAADCPAPCRDEYARVLGGAADLDAAAAALDAVFLDDDAPCTQPEVSP